MSKQFNSSSFRSTCSVSFREASLLDLPGLDNDEGHWNLYMYLSFSRAFNLGEPIKVSRELVAACYDKTNELKNNNSFSAEKYLNKFKEDVGCIEFIIWEFRGGEYDYLFINHLCREVVYAPPTRVVDAIINEKLKFWSEEELVLTVSGTKFTRKTRSKLRDSHLKRAVDKNKMIGLDGMQVLFSEYLNGLNPNTFTKILKYLPEAEKGLTDTFINKRGEVEFCVSLAARREQAEILKAIFEQPQPFYSASTLGNTNRLFSVCKGLQGLHKYLRGILTQDWVEIDLMNAHLAIVARLWNIPEVTEYLKKGKSIWTELLPHLGYEASDKVMKDLIKEYLYSLIYGKSEINLEKVMFEETLRDDIYNLFISHPLMAAVLEARNKRKAQIGSSKVWKTFKGREFRVKLYKDEKGKLQSNVLSILSCECSEIEMLLLVPIINLAKKTDDFIISLYQFDGLSLSFTNKTKKDRWLKKIVDEVESIAKKLGIETKLEIK